MLQDRKKLEENLIPILKDIKTNKKRVGQIKKEFIKYDLHEAEIQKYFSFPEEIKSVDLRILYLLTEEIYKETKDFNIDPSFYFTTNEIKESKQYSGHLERKEQIKFPITFANAQMVDSSSFMVVLSIKNIKQLLDNQLLHYNFDIQREAKITKRNDKIILEPTVNTQNVKEITEHLRNNTLVPTVLVFNCDVRSSLTGEEIIYDSKRQEITITEDTKMSIVDGYHRCKALSNALEADPNINFNFAVLITNYSIKKSMQYQAQLSKATPLSKTRVQELEAKRYSDIVVQQLREESDLKNRISQTSRVHSVGNELVSYNVLADTIDETFSMNTRIEALDTADYLVSFFNYLIGSYPDEFLNPQEHRRTSIMTDNNMFAGYIVLAKRMQENNIKLSQMKNILDNIDFKRNNPLWRELDILNNGTITNTNKTRRNLINYFKQLPIKKIE